MLDKLPQLIEEAGAHSARLVCTSGHGHPAWEPWQVILKWQDGSEWFCTIRATPEAAIEAALRKPWEKHSALTGIS